MADIRIKDLPETSDVGAEDYVAVDNAGDGTRKFTLRQLVASVGAPEFVVNVNASGEADKTLSEINTAISNGYVPVVLYDGGYYQLAETTETAATFTKCAGPSEMAEISITSSAVIIETNTLTSDDIDNGSGVIGENVSDALDNLAYNITNFSETVDSVQTMTEDHEMEIYDLDTRVTVLESGGGGGGTGLTQTEKNLILALFEKAAYAENDAGSAYDQLESLWVSSTKTITYNLSHVISVNTETSIESGQMYTTVLAIDNGYIINSVVVTMGGEDITSTAYRSGSITIPRVTGNIVISATAVLAAQSITATYTQSGTVYDTDSLDRLKADLVVTANYSGGTSETVPSSDYTLSGTLTEGTSTITVSYAGLTTTFSVTVSTFSTEPSIAAYDSSLNSSGIAGTITGACYTNAYEFELDVDAIKETQYYDATNNYSTAGSVMYQIKYYTPDSVGISFGSRGKTCHFDSSGNVISYTTPNRTAEASIGDARQKTQYFTLSDNIVGIKFSLTTADIDDSYAYFDTTVSGIMPIGVIAGDVIFAGRNTQYYGKRNITD